MKKISNCEKLYKALDRVLNYSLPKNIVKLKIELEVGAQPLITVSYIPDTVLDENSPLANEQFNVAPIRKKRENK